MVLDSIFSNPVTTVSQVSKHFNKAYNTIQNIFNIFAEFNIIQEEIKFINLIFTLIYLIKNLILILTKLIFLIYHKTVPHRIKQIEWTKIWLLHQKTPNHQIKQEKLFLTFKIRLLLQMSIPAKV